MNVAWNLNLLAQNVIIGQNVGEPYCRISEQNNMDSLNSATIISRCIRIVETLVKININ